MIIKRHPGLIRSSACIKRRAHRTCRKLYAVQSVDYSLLAGFILYCKSKFEIGFHIRVICQIRIAVGGACVKGLGICALVGKSEVSKAEGITGLRIYKIAPGDLFVRDIIISVCLSYGNAVVVRRDLV